MRRVFFFLDLPNDDTHSGSVVAAERIRRVAFDRVGYVYPDGRRALADVSFEAQAGQTVAIVGPTGAGKTTLAYLIPGFLQATSGRVLLDGIDVRKLDIGTLRDRTAYVFQEHQLLADTVANNLRLARPAATDAELEQAARASGAHEFIEALPDGYQTFLGRDGGTLSVGQKQRLSIARALLRDAPVLILDEPTAALDPGAERSLVESLDAAKRDRIVLVIAHRLSTIAGADLILFMEAGRIMEQGAHAQLMARGGAYADFVRLQAG